MTYSDGKKRAVLLGVFTLVTLLLALTAIGRAVGVSVGEALYLGGLILTLIFSRLFRQRRH